MSPLLPVVPCVWLKPGVRFAERPPPGGIRILSAIDQAAQALGQDLLITSGADSHSTGRHAVGEAYDIGTKTLDVATILRLFDFLQKTLGDRFTVLYESPTPPIEFMLVRIATINPHATGEHLHCQVRRGTTYPPGDGGDGEQAV